MQKEEKKRKGERQAQLSFGEAPVGVKSVMENKEMIIAKVRMAVTSGGSKGLWSRRMWGEEVDICDAGTILFPDLSGDII